MGLTTSIVSCCLCPEPEKDEDTKPVVLNDVSELYLSLDDAALPPFSCIQDVRTKKQLFFGYTLDLVREHNQKINETREIVHALKEKLAQADDDLKTQDTAGVPQFELIFNQEEMNWLQSLAKLHRVSHAQLNEAFFSELLMSMDIIPPSMALAQAANESAWGTSRFAVEANNLFGQWCFSPGCGVVPQLRPEGATYEVKVFETPSESVGQYMLNINRNSSYEKVRNIRHSYRQQQEVIPGTSLVGGLENYSERGHHYIEELRHMIGYNNLSQWDNTSSQYPDISQLSIPNC
ncbi:glucosaminidase domain-containing protein [Litoribrevibacter albus]|uniref:glucosaminidase domain-containing protein n=1 Tax=Litoribrevibacter albus TaxID=1473156 RepID=UPI0024E0ED89|nr:glucosaminidase domain-containing protein [Litoribrevibacter albus]